MKKITLGFAFFTLLFFTGCTQSAPQLQSDDATNSKVSSGNISNNPSIATDSGVNIKEGNVTANDIRSKMSSSGGLPNDGTFNNSSEGLQSVYFGFGDYSIVNDMYKAIDKNFQTLKNYNGKIKIEGNCDEFGTDEFNYALGLKRAKIVKDALVSKGIPAGMFSIISLGESTPVCTDATDECYAKNRRVDLKKQ
ncbi:MAG: OmpA family protein [Epsilonproteobacteria bacterium]|nr:OmpA family protein [Campylobacterota bacterium]